MPKDRRQRRLREPAHVVVAELHRHFCSGGAVQGSASVERIQKGLGQRGRVPVGRQKLAVRHDTITGIVKIDQPTRIQVAQIFPLLREPALGIGNFVESAGKCGRLWSYCYRRRCCHRDRCGGPGRNVGCCVGGGGGGDRRGGWWQGRV